MAGSSSVVRQLDHRVEHRIAVAVAAGGSSVDHVNGSH
jgi:hypothetical protein